MAAIIPQLLDVHTPSTEINQFLEQLAHNPHNRFRIHPHVIAYNANIRIRVVTRSKRPRRTCGEVIHLKAIVLGRRELGSRPPNGKIRTQSWQGSQLTFWRNGRRRMCV